MPYPGGQGSSQKSEQPPKGRRNVLTAARVAEGGHGGTCPLHLMSGFLKSYSMLQLLPESQEQQSCVT